MKTTFSCLIYLLVAHKACWVNAKLAGLVFCLACTSLLVHPLRETYKKNKCYANWNPVDKMFVYLVTTSFMVLYHNHSMLWLAISYMIFSYHVARPKCSDKGAEMFHVSMHIVTGCTMLYLLSV